MTAPLVSVVIPAMNEEDYIAKTIRSVTNTGYPNLEIVVVANGCSDDTAKIARSSGAKVISTKQRGIALARNMGARKSKGELLMFLDADTLVSKHLISELVRTYTKKTAVSVCKVKPDNKKVIARVLMALKGHFLLLNLYRYSNGMIFCSRRIFDKVGGFPEDVKVREDGIFVRTAARYYGNFKYVHKSHVVTSMRRYERTGYLGVIFFWIKEWLLGKAGVKKKDEYPVVR